MACGPKTEEAKTGLTEFLARDPPQVYYQRQLEVIFERDFFHWLTVRARWHERRLGR